jgi:hypothetical protein
MRWPAGRQDVADRGSSAASRPCQSAAPVAGCTLAG